VQLAPGGTKSTAKRAMMEVLLKSLQSLVAEAALKNMPINKPGPTLLEGETGTGKSFAAELFSLRGDRRPYHQVNLAAVNKELLEARLRGYIKGAFTGAVDKREGWFEKADGGILFLDELQSAGIEFQTQLLDLLDPSTNQVKVAKIGEDETRGVFDVKVIIAVNEEIDTLIAEKRLRRDIFYRIRNIVRLPPLRDRFRVDDNGQLMQTLLRIYRWKSATTVAQQDLRNMTTDQMERLFPKFSSAAIEHLQRHTWPGNLREFERVANDLYWEMEEGLLPSNRIDGADVLRAIDLFKIGATRSKLRQEVSDGPEDSVRREVQAALRTHHFVIKNVLPQLSRYKLSSYLALKTYLRDNESMLDPDIVADSKVRRFIQKRPLSTGSARSGIELSNSSATAPED
jgi:transcriptional regulator with PAS, ATPase and Fis domain